MTFTGKAAYDASPLPDLVDDVSDLVRLISPFDTPLLDALGTPLTPADTTRHEWLDKPLRGGESVTRENYTQIFTEVVSISGSMDAVGLHAVEREFDYQVIQRLRELLRNLELTVICGFKASANPQGGAAVPRTMGGLLQFISGPEAVIADAAGADLDESTLNAALRQCWEKGGRPNAIVCNGFQKCKINAFAFSKQRYEPGDPIAVYRSDFGEQRVMLSRWVPADTVLLLDLNKIHVRPLQGCSFFVKPLAESGDFKKAQIIGEYTLEVLNGSDGGHGLLTNLATKMATV